MHASSKVATLSALLVALFHVSAASYNIPILAWSSIPSAFSSSSPFSTINSQQFESSLAELLGASEYSSAPLVTAHPEVVVLFVEPNLSTDQVSQLSSAYSTTPDGGQLKSVKSLVETSVSSLVAPYGTTEAGYSFVKLALPRIARKLALEQHVIVTSAHESDVPAIILAEDNVVFVPLDELSARLPADIFTNGQADIIVVWMPSEAGVTVHDDLVRSVDTAVAARTPNYVALYTANAAGTSTRDIHITLLDQSAALRATRAVFFDGAVVAATNNCTNNTIVYTANFFVGPMLETYVLCAILLAILFVGLCSLWELQTPERFDVVKPGAKMIM